MPTSTPNWTLTILNVVFDASSLVGAVLKADSVPERAFIAARQSARIWLSLPVAAEIRAVLQRPKFRPYTTPERTSEFLLQLLGAAHWADPCIRVADCRDQNDNMYLELALAARADLIVSSDRDLLTLHPWRGIDILTPAHLLHRLHA